jgi:hypothetical protein
MADTENKIDSSEDTIEVDELTLDSFIGFNHEFENKTLATDPKPLEVSFRASTEKGVFRFELSCEYKKEIAPAHVQSEADFRMVRVYRAIEGKSISQTQLEDHVMDLNFADKAICLFWLNSLYKEIMIAREAGTKTEIHKVLKNVYQVKFDKKSNLILDVATVPVEKSKSKKTKKN